MAKADLEVKVLKAIDAVKAAINTKIGDINTEKDDSITLTTVETDAFYYEDWGMDVMVYDPCVLFHVSTETLETRGAESSEKVQIMIQLNTSDRGISGSEALMKLLMRYRRVIKEVAAETFRKFHGLRIVDLPTGQLVVQHRNCYLLGVGIEFNIVC